MILFKNFFKNKKDLKPKRVVKKSKYVKRDKKGRVHIAMHTSIFGQAAENFMVSNSMLSALFSSIQACVEPYSTKEKIVIDAYETRNSDEDAQKLAKATFKNYVGSCLEALKKQHYTRLALFFSFFVIGIAIEVVLYGFLHGYDVAGKYYWLFKSCEVLANLFIWQFGGYVAFEFLGEEKAMKRYKQIEQAQFEVKHWE